MSATFERSTITSHGNFNAAQADGDLPIQLPLELLIDDPEIIRALLEYPDGESRNEYAIEAMKIGVLALRHVGGQANVDVIRRENDRLIGGVQKTFDQYTIAIQERVEGKLKEYFDPKDGRFTDRVQRLVAQDGELSLLLKSFIDGENSLFARTLLSHVGRDSALMRLLDPQQSDGLLTTLRKSVDDQLCRQRDHLLNEFSLDNDASCLSKLKRELIELLATSEKKNQQFQEEVKVSLAKIVTQRQEAERSTRHGLAFEDAVCDFLIRQSQHVGDVATPTGQTTGLIKNCKVGDCVVELGPDSAAPGAKIAIEAKEEGGYSLARAREEVETARKNRGADWGLFVFSKRTAPTGLEPFGRYGNDFIVVWDAEDPTSDVFLKAGVIAARALCFRNERQSAAQQVDFEVIDKAILEIEKRASNLDEVRKSAETIQSSSGKILERVRIDREALEKQVEVLREKVKDLRQMAEQMQ